jgi:ribosomal-protein-alanine N-acetyltransferase
MSLARLWIRDFHPEDFETICQIDRICFAPDIAFSRSEFLFFLHDSKSITYLAERMNSIVGFVLAKIESPSIAHVVTLDVVPVMRRCRVGTRLMNRLHDELRERGISVTVLEVGVQNLGARRLYERLGYSFERLLPGYYAGKEDACRMRREAGN